MPASTENWGYFDPSQPAVQLLNDGRAARLNNDFSYVDSGGNAWLAPSGSVVDGASIPRPFWSIVGGPLEGRYRNASIVHDIYCADADLRKRYSSDDVHFVFYCAMRCAGVEKWKAAAMYWAVLNYGPSWKLLAGTLDAEAGWSQAAPVFQYKELPATIVSQQELVTWTEDYFKSKPELTHQQIKSIEPPEL